MARSGGLSEQRARAVTREILSYRGWDIRAVSSGGQLLEESEYRAFPTLAKLFEGKSKTGGGHGKPDFLLVSSPDSLRPLVTIETKASYSDLKKAINEANHYGNACYDMGSPVLSVGIAGAEKELYGAGIQRRIHNDWKPLTLHHEAIDWIPSPQQTELILAKKGQTEVAPERPPDSVLAAQANRMNQILRECGIKDEFRPIYAATFMLALWEREVSADPDVVLEQVNANAHRALKNAQKSTLSDSLRVDVDNDRLAQKAWELIDILTKLNIRSFLHQHDYLGQLYETFFRYTGGNTIGQFFTPRHIIDMMCQLVNITPNDVVFDPACGTGGFLIGALNRMVADSRLPYKEAVDKVKSNLFGIEDEPTTAALCVTNMILRGDGKSGVIKGDCFKLPNYPPVPVDCALMNPPFPHKKGDIPASDFIDRALRSVKHKGYVSSVVPYSMLVKIGDWHKRLLRENRISFVGTMPSDLFNPYASFNTAVIVIQKGVPQGTHPVFFARISNDGFKLKKNARVVQIGDQIPALLKAFRSGNEIPEFTAFQPITAETKEWSPEYFIKGAPHSDVEFIVGFEEAIRAQAAFYVADGHKLLSDAASTNSVAVPGAFSSTSRLSLSGIEMGPIRIEDWFSIVLGGKDEVEDLDEGPVPIVTTSEFNNGVATWRKANRVYHPPAITVATDGSVCSSFIQEAPFYAFYKVAILRPLPGIMVPQDALYFMAYLLNRERWRYVYARKFGKGRIKDTVVYGPTKRGKPDFQKMAELVTKTNAYPIIESFRNAFEDTVKKRWPMLVANWKDSRGPLSFAHQLTDNDAYREIVSLGWRAVPLILKELKKKPDHWFLALQIITGNDPVPEKHRGDILKMAEAWIKWGDKNGLNKA